MRKGLWRAVSILLISVLLVSEFSYSAFAVELPQEGEVCLEEVEGSTGDAVFYDENEETSEEIDEEISDVEADKIDIISEDELIDVDSTENDLTDDLLSDVQEDEQGLVDEENIETSDDTNDANDEDLLNADEELLEDVLEENKEESEEVPLESEEINAEEALYSDPYEYLKIEGTTVLGLQAAYQYTNMDIEIPYGIKRIANNAFQNAHVTYAYLPETLEEIGDNAFYGCPLRAIDFPDSLKKIGSKAYYSCYQIAGSAKQGPQSITIPKNVTNIGVGAFHSCVTVKDVTINSNVLNISVQGTGTNARFGQCEIVNLYFGDNVTKVPAYLFQGAKFSQSGIDIVFPKQIKQIGEYAFDKAEKINSIRFEEDSQLTLIGHDAFYEVFKENSTYTVDLSNTRLETIGYNAFYGCKYMGGDSFSLPNGLKQIGDQAFYNVSFADLYLPGTITYIGKKAFTTTSVEPYTWLMAPANSYVYKWFKENCKYWDYTATYPITYVMNGGVNSEYNAPYYYHTTENKYYINDPEERDMYTFGGWYLDAKFSKKIDYITNDYTNPLTLYAKWEGIPCNVSLNLFDNSTEPKDGGSTKASLPAGVDDTLTINYDTAIPALPTPTRPGYVFSRWVVVEGETGNIVTVKKGDIYRFYENERFYALWTPITYTVKLHSNLDKDTIKQITLTFDKVETITNPFVNHGYQIYSWADSIWNEYDKINSDSSSNNGGEPWNLADTKGKIVDLYAQWKESVYNVTFDYNGGNAGSNVKNTTVNYNTAYSKNKDGNTITWPSAPTKSNSTFIGWFDEYGNEITKDTACVIEKDHTLTAYWKANPTLEDVRCYVMEPGETEYTELKSDDNRYDGYSAPEGTRIRFVGEGGSSLYWDFNIQPSISSSLYEDEFVVSDDFSSTKEINIRAYKDGAYSQTFSITVTKKSLTSEEKLKDITAPDFKAIDGDPSNPDMSKVTNVQDEMGFWVTVGTEYESTSPLYWKEGTNPGISVAETGAVYKFPYVHVYYGNILLKEKTDYTITYKNNTKPAAADEVNAKNASIAPTMTVTFKGDYSGKLERRFTITAAVDGSGDALVNIKKVKVNMPKINLEYTGNPVGWGIGNNESSVIEVVNTEKEVLTEDVDYECEYFNNVNAGTATLVIKGKGKYFGRIEKTFKITPYDIGADSKVLANGTTGRIMPKITGGMDCYNSTSKCFILPDQDSNSKASFTSSKNGATTTLVMLDGSSELVEGRDYTLKFNNNKAIASKTDKKAPTIAITGKGNYKGTYFAKVTYDIVPGKFNDPIVSDVIFNDTKAGLKPLVVVTQGSDEIVKLKEKNDYTVEFYYDQNNVEVINGTNPKRRNKGDKLDPKDKVLSKNGTVIMKAVITGVKNYAGFSSTKCYVFVSNARGFDDYGRFVLLGTVTDVAYAEKAGVLKPTIKIEQKNFKNGYSNVLKAGIDYDKNFVYQYAEDTLVKRKDKKVTTYMLAAKGSTVDMKKDIIPAGTKINVNIKGIKKYDGSSVWVSFYVLNSLKSSKVTVTNAKYYTGNPIYLNKSDLKVTIGSGANMITLEPKDYEIIGYKNNTKKGSAKVTIKGTGQYMDSKEISFTIKAVGQK